MEKKKAEDETKKPTKKKKIDYNFDLRIIFSLLSVVKTNIFIEEKFFYYLSIISL